MPLTTESSESRSKIFELAEDKIGLGLWVWDYKANRMQWSHGVYKLFGLSNGSCEPSLEQLRRLIHPDDLLSMQDVLETIERKLSLHREFRVVLPNGRIKWVQNSGEMITESDSQRRLMVGYLLDITARKEREMNLSFYDRRREALAKDTFIAIWSRSRDGKRARVQAWEDWTGQRQEDVADFGWLKSIHPDDRERVRTARLRSLESGLPYLAKFRLRMRDGSYLPVHSRATLVRNEVHDEIEWVGVLMQATATSEEIAYDTTNISGVQIRAARAMLNWSVADLSAHSDVSSSSIRRVEDYDGVTHVRDKTLTKIQAALERQGIQFINMGDEGYAVQYRRE